MQNELQLFATPSSTEMFHVEHPLLKMVVNVPRGTLSEFSLGGRQTRHNVPRGTLLAVGSREAR